MFHYLFTNDLRISRLEEALIHASHCIKTNTVPSAQENKNENNNIKTLAFYFNLTETSNCSVDCDINQNVRNTVLNFIKKFQFPNPRTSASLQDAVNDGITLAPMRIVVQLLYNMNMLFPTSAYLTTDEILNFIFFNSAVAKTTNPNILSLAQQLIDYRTSGVLPTSIDTAESHRVWKHSDRQIREMTKILQWAGCVTMEDNKIFIEHRNLSMENKAVLFDTLSFNGFWTPPSNDASDPRVLTSYRQYMDMEEVVISNSTLDQKYKTTVKYNCIYFGAPGTGKSHELNKNAKENFGNNIERVTFYPNYAYAQFVGAYKPVMTTKDGKEEITYSYVPGPFIRQWIKAQSNPDENFLLIVEELNRANAPAVFGDMFQLLDRKNGVSEYPVATSEDLRKYLNSLIAPDNTTEEEIKAKGYLPQGTNVNEITIPANMYIWTTMNSADQGVFPLDTAFKRRWDYKYFSVFDRKDIDYKIVEVGDKKYTWGDIRDSINNKLAEKNVNEDKFIGPYFLSETVFNDNTKQENDLNPFENAFSDKVLMYLFEDAARQYRRDIFKTDGKPPIYSKLIDKFKSNGFDVFAFTINEVKEDNTSNDTPIQ